MSVIICKVVTDCFPQHDSLNFPFRRDGVVLRDAGTEVMREINSLRDVRALVDY